MASVCSPRRQLAPTVGPEVALAGVHIRAGILDINGERTVSALVQRIYNMDFINDNAGCFANGGKFPQNGRTIEFGSIRVYFGTVPVRQRLSPVLVAPDPPRWLCAGRAAGSMEVMMAGAVNTGKGAMEEGDERAASTRPAKPPLERDAGVAGASSAPPATPLQAAMHTLATPIAQNIDPAKAQEELEATRKALLTGGADIIRAQLNLTLREYNAAHGFASVSAHAARIPENRLKARNLDQDLRKEVLTGKSASVSIAMHWETQCNRQCKLSRRSQIRLNSNTGITGTTKEGKIFRIEDMHRSKLLLCKKNLTRGSQRQKTGSQPWAGPKKQWVEKKPWGQKKNWQEPVKYTMEAAMDQPCRWHTPNPDHPSNHLTKDCSWTKYLMQKGAVKDAQGQGCATMLPPPQDMLRQQQLPPPPPLTGANALPVQPQPNRQQYQQVNRVEENRDQPPPPAPLGRNVYEDPHLCMVVFVTEPTDRQSVHRRSMEVNAVMPAVPKYMLWSDQEITWSFKDHPKIMPNPGGYALVVDPIMKGPETRVKFSKVLIDNGSSINIMYKHTMRTLGITENMLQPTHTTFHGIVPGLSCAPIGKVRVDVSFGGRDNCRVENIEFEVVDLDSPYHALLGRPALAAFMASTHTAYLKMKMPAPRGPLTVVGNYKVSMETASAGSNLAESLVIAEEKKRMQTAVALAQSSKLSLAAMSGNLASPAFKPTNETKDIVLDSQSAPFVSVPASPSIGKRSSSEELAEHSLNVRKDAKPVRQPLRRFAEDRRKIIGEEVTKLLVAGFIVEVTHTEWLANPVMVEKKKDENLEAQAPKNYPHFQKMTYGVFMAATKLKHYFEEHPMKVVSEAPISDIMGNKDASGRIAKWAIQLSPYVPVYERRDAIKSQALADFLVDWAEIQYKPPEHKIEYWKMHFDGSKLKEGLGAGVVLTSPKGDHLRYVLQVHFKASNNVAEYEALIHGLKVAKEIGALQIVCYGDSDLVVQQCSGDWDARDANMASYRFHVQKIAGFFEGCEFHHVPRAENEAADALSKLGSSRQEIPPGIALAHLRVPSIKPSPESESIFVPESHVVPMEIDGGNPGTAPANSGTVPVNSGTATPMPEEAMLVDNMDIDMPVFVVREAPSWVKPIKEFLVNGTLPVDENESRRIQRRSKAYTIINGETNSGSRSFRGSSAGIRSWRWHVLAFIFLLLAQIIFDIFRRGMKVRISAYSAMWYARSCRLAVRTGSTSVGAPSRTPTKASRSSSGYQEQAMRSAESAPARAAEHCHSRIRRQAPFKRSLIREKVSGTTSPGHRVLKS
ncbi:hypothetical protein QYE76_066967 [Lolium multiflorum]|uniref:RNase H type-1 domain-containing protein n=1 Tax=Lolium multiflorum TaxID=4521 RepID=A0AAD8SBN7_LOLMU|nr:hypothetical protein QYE76_066967 [Lolium multiflorum]